MSVNRARCYGVSCLVGVGTYLAISGASLAIPAITAITTARLLALFRLDTLPPVPPADHAQRLRISVILCATMAMAIGFMWATPPETPLFGGLYRMMTRPLTLATMGVALTSMWAIAILPYLARRQTPPLQAAMRMTAQLTGLYVISTWLLVIYDDGPILARIFTPDLGVIDGVIISAIAFILLSAVYRILRPSKVDHPR